MSGGIKLEPMSIELFLASTMQAALDAGRRKAGSGATIPEMARQLDADEYWSGKFVEYTFEQKCDYVRRKMQTMKDERGMRRFWAFKRAP